MPKILEVSEKYILYATAFLAPLLVLTLFPNFYETPKLVLLSIGVVLILAIKALRTFLSNEVFQISIGNFDIPVILILISYLLSGILRTPNRMEAFFLPGMATIVIFGALTYFLANQFTSQDKKSLSFWLLFSGVAGSVVYLLSSLGVLSKVPQLPAFAKDPQFTSLGGIYPLALFLAVIFPLGIVLLLKEQAALKKMFLAVCSLIILLGGAIAVYNLLPGKPSSPSLPDWTTSWSVALESVKESPILGIGPGNYLTAFNKFRPLSYNQTPNWNVRFTSASDFFLTAVSEVGLLGIIAFAILATILFRKVRNAASNVSEVSTYIPLLVVSLIMLLLPTPTIILILFFLLLSLVSGERKVTLNPGTSRIIGVLLVIAISVFAYQGVRVLDAEITFKKALDSLSENNAGKTYTLITSAINKNRFVDRYRLANAQLNLLIARNLAQKKDITEAERTTISNLVQQSIAEGKAAVSLNPQRSGNWEILGRIYQAIMPLAQGADEFTIQTMTQAVNLDPVNPNLRIALGGVYYALGRYDDAIDAFKLATLAKSDLANAHYNLAIAYREKGDIDKAIAELKATLSLVQKDSEDEKVAKAELATLESKKAQKVTGGSENLTPPQPPTGQIIKPPLELPKEATPPASQ